MASGCSILIRYRTCDRRSIPRSDLPRATAAFRPVLAARVSWWPGPNTRWEDASTA
jgi:hypothetical protein